MVQKLFQFYHISNGSITLACDGLLALQQSTPTSLQLCPDTSCYDIICAIRQLRLTSPLEWRSWHVEGHQDDFNLVENLDRWGQLNVKAD